MKAGMWRELGLSALFFALLFVVWTWPLATAFTTAFAGPGDGDANQYVWNAYNFQQAVAAGTNPFFTSLLLYPEGISLVMHTYTPIIGLVNVLLRQEILAVNVCLLLSFVLSGVGAYRLCRRWVASPLLAGAAGVMFAFSPYKLAHLPEHYHLLLTAPVPFYVAAFLDAFAFAPGRWLPQIRSAAQVLICLGLGLLTLLSDYYTLFALLYFSVGYAAYFGLRLGRIKWGRWPVWLTLVLVVAGCNALMAYLEHLGVSDKDGFWWGGDIAGYLLPPPGSRWLSTDFSQALYRQNGLFNVPGSVENVMFLGYTVPLLALAAFAGRPRKDALPTNGPLGWLTLLFVMLTLPQLRIFGMDLFRLPTGLLHFVPFINNIRCPTRFVMMVSLLLPLIAFPALEARWKNHWSNRWRVAAAATVLALVLVEFQPTAVPLTRTTDVPQAYRVVAQLPENLLFTVPFGLVDGYRQKGRMHPAELFYQTRHHKKLLGAYISRIPPETFARFDQDPVVHALLLLQNTPAAAVAPPTAAQDQVFLRTYGSAIFLLYPAFRNSPAHRYLRAVLQGRGYTEQVVGGYVLLRRATGV